MYARPFDEARLQFSGEALHVVDGIPLSGPGRAPFSVSAAGVLAYWSYSVGTPAVLQWFDRTGRAAQAVPAPAQYIGFDLAQNGQLVYSRTAPNGTTDVWRSDIVRRHRAPGNLRRSIVHAAMVTRRHDDLVFSSPDDRLPPNLFTKRVLGRQSGFPSQPLHVARLSVELEPGRPLDCQRPNRFHDWQRSVDTTAAKSRRRASVVQHPSNESQGKRFARRRWIAYVTDESGEDEVWVASFPSGDIRRQVSASGGMSPRWGEGGREIFYISLDREVMAVPLVRTAPDSVSVRRTPYSRLTTSSTSNAGCSHPRTHT